MAKNLRSGREISFCLLGSSLLQCRERLAPKPFTMAAGQRACAGRRGKGIGYKKENVARAFIQKILVGERRSSGG
jgi:hypothetical protein